MRKSRIHKLHIWIDTKTTAGLIVAICSFFLIVLVSLTDVYEKIELVFYDLRFNFKPKIKQWDKLTIIRIDDNSIYHMGKFPWPRHIYAQGTLLLKQINSRIAAFDIEFPDESPITINENFYKKIITNKNISIKSKNINNLIFNNDYEFSKIIRQSNQVILPFSFHTIAKKNIDTENRNQEIYNKAYKRFLAKASIKLSEKKISLYKEFVDPERTHVAFPTPLFSLNAKAFGFVDSDFDIDGASRRIRLVRVFENRLFFHLSLVILANYCNIKLKDIIIEPGEYILLKNVENRVSYKIEDIRIPIDNKGRMLINWAGTFDRAFNHIPYHALLDYNDIEELVHDIISEKEISIPNSKYSLTLQHLAKVKQSLSSSQDPAEKLALYKQIDMLQSDLDASLDELFDPFYIQLESLKKAYAKQKNKVLEIELEELENFITALQIVKRVERLSDHITITGLTATATQDLGITPTSSNYWMVGSYPNIINTILQKKFLYRLPLYSSYILILFITLSLAIFVQRLNAKKSILTILFSTIIINTIIFLVFAYLNLWIDQTGTNFAILIPTLTIAAIKLHKEESQKRFIKNAFSHYLSPPVIDRLIKHPDALNLGGVEQEITTFFSDIQGFSTISEKLSPPQLVSLLNEYLSEMSDIILHYDGTVDKYEGDAIMAFYGAPHQFKNHALRACFAAIDMQDRLKQLRNDWIKKGKNELFVRMGINTGLAVVGNMGSRTRMNYTVMGDSVNLASRLEGANKYYGTFTMVSESTFLQAYEDIEARELDTIQVVGKKEPTKVYEVLSKKNRLSTELSELREIYNQGLNLFKDQHWKEALKKFKAAVKIVHDDGPSLAYIKRCKEFIKKPPSANWNGVYTLKSK